MRLGPGVDVVKVLEDVHADGLPRLIERDGEALAVVVDPAEYAALPKSARRKREILALAGSWADLDADGMIEALYRRRRAAQSSPSIEA